MCMSNFKTKMYYIANGEREILEKIMTHYYLRFFF